MKKHKVEGDDCLSKIAAEVGLLPETIWQHEANTELRALRGNGDVLGDGDEVAIPDVETREEEIETGKIHRFTRIGIPSVLRVCLLDGDEPRAGLTCQIEVDGVLSVATTDGEGYLVTPIPPDASDVKITVDPHDEETDEVRRLELGTLDPVEEEEGAVARLLNLGYLLEPLDELDDELAARSLALAISWFQEDYGQEPTGELDDDDRALLVDVHGS